MKEKLLGKTPTELQAVALAAGLPKYAAAQMSRWMYSRRVTDIDAMTDISKEGRERLKELFESGTAASEGLAQSSDGTKKYLFPVQTPRGVSHIESVVIPDEDRRTLCVSSQAGCRMGCRFCMTGRQGWHGNLDAADILNQFISVEEGASLTNAVFMGMGEPLDNYPAVSRAIEVLTSDWGFGWSPKRITLSTIGVLPVLRQYLDGCRCHIAVSLHNPFPEERMEMMPVQKAYSITEVVRLLKQYDWSAQRRVSFEYTMFDGWNDTPRHAEGIIRLLRGLECRVNLIRFHKIPDFEYVCSRPDTMSRFRDTLTGAGITCTIRASRGEDILAACGMLAGRK